MKVFYHNDNDGKCAAHIIDRFYNLDSVDHCAQQLITFFPMQYGKQFPVDEIIETEKIYILDYSIEPEEMAQLLEITQDIVWIDHHKTAIEKYNDAKLASIKGIRNINYSGCENTWKYLYPDKDMPIYVELIGDRDTWRNPKSPFVRDFHYALGIYDINPVNIIWKNIMKDTGKFISEGNIIFRYAQQQNAFALQERGFWIDFHGYKTFAINSDTVKSSEFFADIRPDADIWMSFRYIPNELKARYKGGYWTVSIYSDKIDVSEIAKQYEYYGKTGGGHKGASGFLCANLDFLCE